MYSVIGHFLFHIPSKHLEEPVETERWLGCLNCRLDELLNHLDSCLEGYHDYANRGGKPPAHCRWLHSLGWDLRLYKKKPELSTGRHLLLPTPAPCLPHHSGLHLGSQDTHCLYYSDRIVTSTWTIFTI